MEMKELWERTCALLEAEMNPVVYTTWIANNLTVVELDGSTLVLRLSMENMQRQLLTVHLARITDAASRAAGKPIAAPSANTSGRPSTTTAAHVMEDMQGKIAAVVEGGACAVGVESTVISLAGEQPRLLRPGGISLEQLEAVLGPVAVDRALREKIDDTEKVSAPGMKYRHYAPTAPVTAVSGDPAKTAAWIAERLTDRTGVICFDEFAAQFAGHPCHTLGHSTDGLAHAQNIFDALRAFDSEDVDQIFAQCPDDAGIGLAVANRLKKAAGFHVVEL